MKRIICVLFSIITVLCLLSCANSEEGKYVIKTLNTHNGEVTSSYDKIRFYNDTPNVAYIGLKDYLDDFADQEYNPSVANGVYKYSKNENCYLLLDSVNNLLVTRDLMGLLNGNVSSGGYFLGYVESTSTKSNDFIVDLDDYKIEIYGGKNDCYLPLAFLNSLFGDNMSIIPSYNGKDLYLFSDNIEADYYGSNYYSLLNSNEERKEDVINYNYNIFCFVFDKMRGYTSQMLFSDFNIISMGLDGTLTTYYPKIKELLLSKSYNDYKCGIMALFSGLYDGGHTALASRNHYILDDDTVATLSDMEGVNEIFTQYVIQVTMSNLNMASAAKLNAFGDGISYINDEGKKVAKPFYYYFSNQYKIAYIAFDNFVVNDELWQKYYNGDKSVLAELEKTDTYAFVLSSLKKAKIDGANNVIFDFTSNNGGEANALNGIFGIINGGNSEFVINYIPERRRIKTSYFVDINLDSKFDEADITLANELKNSYNISILTSNKAFSCGNLFPSLMKDNGFNVLGEKSGGGSCVLRRDFTLDGIPYYRSGILTLSNKKGENIDSGIEPNYKIVDENGVIDYSKVFDLEYMSKLLSEIYS